MKVQEGRDVSLQFPRVWTTNGFKLQGQCLTFEGDNALEII